MYFGYFEITKREIVVSVAIIAIMLIFGFLISGAISDSIMDKNTEFNKALKIDTQDLFEYGMRTNVGNAFVFGDLKAVDTVTYPEIGGNYMYVKKVEEHYNPHTRRVSHTRVVNGKTQTYYTTETYWSWDFAGSESKTCKEITFLDHKFPSSKIDIPGISYIDTIKKSGRVRFKYYGTGTEFTGTIYTKLSDGSITESSNFYNGSNIEETVKRLETGEDGALIAFWVVWVILTGGLVYVFYIIDNRWLEG